MLISYNWLKKFVKIQKTPQAVVDKITLSLAEVESLEKKGEDYLLEIENKGLTNRPDCFSHLGLAREVAAYFRAKLNDPLEKLSALKLKPAKELPVKIGVQAKTLCPRYCGIVLADLKIAPSPNWLKTGLERLNIRSINNVVDITNYVMIELGQPLHAFDYDKVKNHQIIVRTARKGEKIVTLDGVKRDLHPDNLLIADAEKPIGLAGIMGGTSTEVGSATRAIILESANFEAKNNRITSKNLSLRTEASTRFEKGLDLTLTLPAINRAVAMMQQIAGAKVASALIDLQNKTFQPKIVKVEASWLNQFLGIDLSIQEMTVILNGLGFKVEKKNSLLLIKVPSWRQDVSMEADVAEEIARIYGYDNIPVTLPKEEDKPPQVNFNLFWRKKIKLFLKGAGFTEVLTPPFVGSGLLKSCDVLNEDYLQLVNPLTVDQEFMRRSLIPSLLSVTKNNLRYFEKFRLFEIDRAYFPQDKRAPKEISYLTGINVNEKLVKAKGVVEALLDELGIKNYQFSPYKLEKTFYGKVFYPGRTAEVMIKDNSLGVVGEISPLILRRFKIKGRVMAFDLDVDQLSQSATTRKKYLPLPKYPAIVEDLAFIIPEQTLVGEVMAEMKKVSRLIASVELLDSYKNTRTFRLTYQSDKKTLSDQEVEKVRKKIIGVVSRKFASKLKAKV
jgi:phenylalanyl-tRNA synthetase beta chain